MTKKRGRARSGKHKKSGAFYRRWIKMMQRCYNPKNRDYKNYGGRGIKVCSRWHNYDDFVDDVGEPPPGLTLDRIDNDGDYEPGNIQWATKKQQVRNRRDNQLIAYRGETKTLVELAEAHGKNAGTVRSRMARGMSAEEALETPVTQGMERSNTPVYTIGGVSRTLRGWSEHVGIDKRTVQSRRDRGWSVEQALGLSPPPRRVQSNAVTATIRGETKTLKEWCDFYGQDYVRVYRRRKRGWSDEEALGVTPKKRRNPKKNAVSVTINGETKLLTEWCEQAGLGYPMVFMRLKRGWSPEDALELFPKEECTPWPSLPTCASGSTTCSCSTPQTSDD